MSASRVNSRQVFVVRWVIYALVALAVVLPYLITTPQMKFKADEPVKNLYERMDGLKPGSHVLLACDFDPASQAELEPMARALLKHCFKKGLIPVVMTHWSPGVDLSKTICESMSEESGKTLGKKFEHGRDWVFLGFRPGGAMLVLQMGQNLKGAFAKDYYGQATQGMAALQGVNALKNFDLMVDIAAGDTIGWWMAYGSDRFGVPLGAGTTAVGAPDQYPFLQSKQLVGLLGGLRGAADYESLLKAPGAATRGMMAQSAAHVLVIILILVANVRFIAGRLTGGRKD